MQSRLSRRVTLFFFTVVTTVVVAGSSSAQRIDDSRGTDLAHPEIGIASRETERRTIQADTGERGQATQR